MTQDTAKILEIQRQMMESHSRLAPVLEKLDQEGYTHFLSDMDEECFSFQKRIDSEGSDIPLCECNDKTFVNVRLFYFTINHVQHMSVEMSMCHEPKDGNWVDLKIYGINVDTFAEYYQSGFDKLVNMWKAAY